MFLTMEGNQSKRLIVEKLTEFGVPFVDVGGRTSRTDPPKGLLWVTRVLCQRVQFERVQCLLSFFLTSVSGGCNPSGSGWLHVDFDRIFKTERYFSRPTS